MKPKVAFIELTCCAGCECVLLDTNEALFELFEKIDVVDFRLFEEGGKKPAKYDVTFVVGSPSTKEQIKKIKNIRKKTGVLVAFGTCSITGSVWGQKNWKDKNKLIKKVYPKPEGIDNLEVVAVNKIVKVDFEIPACPINPGEFVRLTYDLLHGRFPIIPKRPVCYECQLNGYECLLQKGEPCFGPVTLGGCNAICLKNKMSCQACRGPLDNANFDNLWKQICKQVGKKRAVQILEIFGVKDNFKKTFNVKFRQ